ncbi:uncharacterized protein LOC135466369 [Liolophura sinensis]|uniref:uncharacterized protein LOC135466369 n=1 Tax=Liolophura sinensis TaxID=3198878 RepID=UPI0031591DB0
MVDLKSAYVALEYKHYHNIGSRRAAEQVITYDESVPIYESRLNSQQTDFNSNQTLPNANLCAPNGNHGSTNPKLHQQKCNTNSSNVQTSSPKSKKGSVKNSKLTRERKKDTSKKAKKRTVNRVSGDVLHSVPVRREASLNAKAKLNIFYHETDPIKGIDSSEDSSDEETLSVIAKSVSDGKKQDRVCEEKVKTQDKVCEKKSTTSSLTKHRTPEKCDKSLHEKPRNSKSPVNKATREAVVKNVKSPVKRTADLELGNSDSPKYARRIASLNAEAIMAVTGSSLPSCTQKAARTQVLEAARTKAYMSSRREVGRWVEGRGEEYIQALHSNAPIEWSNRDLVKDSPVKDGLHVKEGLQGTSDPLHLGDSIAPTLDRVGNVDRPLCHTYQSPIHVNVEDCGPYVGSQSHIAAPLPRYSFSPARSVAPGPQCQSYTLAGLGSLSNVQMVPFHQTYNSAFTVPCNHNINVPCNHGNACSLTAPYYGYVHNNYYPSGGSLLQPLPEPCIIPRPHPVPVQCPQAEVKVLIHNPHTEHPFITPREESGPIKVESLTPSPLNPADHKVLEDKQPDPKCSSSQTKTKSHKRKLGQKQDGGSEAYNNSKVSKKREKSAEAKRGSKCKKKPEGKVPVKKKKLSEEVTKDQKRDDKKVEKKKKSALTDGPTKTAKTDNAIAVCGPKIEEKSQKKQCKAGRQEDKGKAVRQEDRGKAVRQEDRGKAVRQEDRGRSVRKEEKGKRKDGPGMQKEESPNKTKRKRVDNHGWSWIGAPDLKIVHSPREIPPTERPCYPAMRHIDGDEVRAGDCVLLCSGPRKSDVPYVAKVTNLWENADDGEMMMSLLWYYRPEHTETGRRPQHMDCEVFASKHKDENSVACIEDKCYVLTYNEYCRYRADLRYTEEGCYRRTKVVPEPEDDYARSARLPPLDADPEIVLLCRQVYDFRQKRILKNPA